MKSRFSLTYFVNDCSIKHNVYKLLLELPKYLRLRIKDKQEISRQSQNLVGVYPRVKFPLSFWDFSFGTSVLALVLKN